MQRILLYNIVFHKHDHDPFWQDSRLVITNYTFLSLKFLQKSMSVAKEVGRRLSTHDLSWHDDTQNCNFAQVGKILEKQNPRAKYCSWRSCCSRGRSKKKRFSWSCKKKERCYFRTSGSANLVEEEVALASMEPRFRKQVAADAAASSGSFQKMTHKTVSLLQLE